MTSDVSMIKSGIDLSNLSKDDDQKLSDIEILDDVNNSNNKNRNFNIETDNAPHLPLLILFAKFLWFGMRAFGGPVAQITLMKEELVDDQKWITKERFNRVYGVYQIIPGPEAYELACYFGYISRGVIGSLLAGLGFAIPGCLLELLCSYLYTKYGVSGTYVKASFHCVQVTVSAMIFRAIYKLSESVLNHHDTKTFMWDRFFIVVFNFLTATIGLNFFASIGISGIMNFLFTRKDSGQPMWKFANYGAYFIAIGTIAFFFLYEGYNGKPSDSIIGNSSAGTGSGSSNSSLFILAIIAGCVSFGGAYTTIPFIYNIAVQRAGFITPQQFLDALAICNMLPTPLVSFVATIGFIGNGIGGSVLMLIGIFLPATIFPIISHDILQRMVDNEIVQPFLDGVASAVIGLLIQTALNFLKGIITNGLDATIFFMSFSVLFNFSNKFTQPMLIVVAATAGQTLYA